MYTKIMLSLLIVSSTLNAETISGTCSFSCQAGARGITLRNRDFYEEIDLSTNITVSSKYKYAYLLTSKEVFDENNKILIPAIMKIDYSFSVENYEEYASSRYDNARRLNERMANECRSFFKKGSNISKVADEFYGTKGAVYIMREEKRGGSCTYRNYDLNRYLKAKKDNNNNVGYYCEPREAWLVDVRDITYNDDNGYFRANEYAIMEVTPGYGCVSALMSKSEIVKKLPKRDPSEPVTLNFK